MFDRPPPAQGILTVPGDLRFHDLCHSAASFMINAGIDLFAVGKVALAQSESEK
jgi:hypothetical protein